MKNILVPTDFSDCSGFALHLAYQIAERNGSKVTVLHVADLPVVADPMGTNLHAFLSPDTLSLMEEKINSKLKEFTSDCPESIKLDLKFDWGNPLSSISKTIDELHSDLVIIGSKGASGTKEIFLGSNAERIIRSSKVPVFTLKSEINLNSIKRIAFGTDGEECPENLINALRNLQDFFDAKLDIVRVNTPLNFMRDDESILLLKDIQKKINQDNTEIHIYNDLNEDRGLMHFAQSINADLIALGTHGKRGFEHFISGSIAEDIVNHAKRPIWTCSIKK